MWLTPGHQEEYLPLTHEEPQKESPTTGKWFENKLCRYDSSQTRLLDNTMIIKCRVSFLSLMFVCLNEFKDTDTKRGYCHYLLVVSKEGQFCPPSSTGNLPCLSRMTASPWIFWSEFRKWKQCNWYTSWVSLPPNLGRFSGCLPVKVNKCEKEKP